VANVFSDMPLSDTGCFITIFSEDRWPEGQLLWIIRGHRVFLQSQALCTVLEQTCQCRYARRHAPRTSVAMGEYKTFLRQSVNIGSVHPVMGFRVATDTPDALIIGEDVKNVWSSCSGRFSESQ
jgi:hypothetical protein